MTACEVTLENLLFSHAQRFQFIDQRPDVYALREVEVEVTFSLHWLLELRVGLWTVLGGKDSYKELVTGFGRNRIPYKPRLLKVPHESELLTSRQEEILSIAFENGSSTSKKTGLRELATRTGVKESTLARFSGGQRKVLREYLSRKSLLSPF